LQQQHFQQKLKQKLHQKQQQKLQQKQQQLKQQILQKLQQLQLHQQQNEEKIKGKEENDTKGNEESNIKGKDEYHEDVKEKGNQVIVLYDFNGMNSGELSIHRNDILIVTNWNIKDGWATGYKKYSPYEHGKFPSALVCQYSENGNSLFLYIYNIKKNDLCIYIYILLN